MPAASNVQQARRVKDFKDRSTSLLLQKAPTRPEIMLMTFMNHKRKCIRTGTFHSHLTLKKHAASEALRGSARIKLAHPI